MKLTEQIALVTALSRRGNKGSTVLALTQYTTEFICPSP